MISVRESLLINAFGHLAGVLIFGIFVFLLIQDRVARTSAGGVKSLFAACLALAWNLGSLLVLGIPETATAWSEITVAASFSVLSLLPAVLFDLSLGSRSRTLARIGYGLSGASIALHVAELYRPGDPYHGAGLTLITFGFGTLTLIAAVQLLGARQDRRRAATSRLVATMALFLLAVSFVHLGNGHAQQIWSQELAFHHAAIPLALLVLLQDYRFILLDAFLRFLANVSLAGVVTLAGVGAWNWGLIPPPGTPFQQAVLAAEAGLTLIGFGVLRQGLQKWLTRTVFRRGDERALFDTLRTPVLQEIDYLNLVIAAIGQYCGASSRIARLDAGASQPVPVVHLQPRRMELEREGIEVVVPLRLSPGDVRSILLGRRGGGRRYLSEDLETLARAAVAAVEQVEQFRELEMRRLVTQAELRALQSQIHPHFLFNALNALYGIIPKEARGARNTVLNLADIFRYFLETGATHVPLEQEIRIVRSYLDIERLRLGEKLHVEFAIDPDAAHVPIPILSIQPLVENAVKHGIAPLAEGGAVRVEASLKDGLLTISVSDSGAGLPQPLRRGVGLENVERRLELSYSGQASLTLASDPSGTAATIRLPGTASKPVEVAR
jgi:hypothetical protein